MRQDDDNDIHWRRPVVTQRPEGDPKQSLDAVSADGIADAAADRKSEACLPVRPYSRMHADRP